MNDFIDFKVLEIEEQNGYDSKLYKNVSSYLCRNAGGTFLWVALVYKELQDVPSWEVQQILKEFSPGLELLYTQMMDQVQHLKLMTMEYYLRILSTAAIVYHPLYLKELVATASLPEKSFHDIQSLNKLVDLCGSFFTIWEETIYFIH